MKKVVLTVVVLCVAAAAWGIYRRIASPAAEVGAKRSGGPVVVRLAPVRQADIREVGSFTGSLQPNSQFIIAPKIAGRLDKLLVNVGDRVTRGQPIARLDDEEFAQQAEQAKAELAVAKATAENSVIDQDLAQRELERVEALRAKQIASESELDAAQSRFKACQSKCRVAEAQKDQKDAAYKAAQVRLAYATIQAVWEKGDQTRVVGERFVDEGALLKANDPIVSVLETQVLIGVINVIERDYPKVGIGQAAAITTDAYPAKVFEGKVLRIAPLLKESSRQARVELEIPNTEGLLRPGMFVRAQIEFSRKAQATVVPVAALVLCYSSIDG